MPLIKRLNMVAGLALTLVVLGVVACASPSEPPATEVPDTEALEQRTFTAVLFPYIPDSGEDNFATMIATLESWFEADNPDIDLELIMDTTENLNLYDIDKLATLLGTDGSSVDMVELDTLTLGSLVNRGLVQPLPFANDLGLLPTALAATKVNSTSYGVPTYLCGNYIYSWDANISNVNSGQGLIDFLSQNPNPAALALIGNFKGGSTLPSVYVDAWADTHTNDPSKVAGSYGLPLDQETMKIFKPVVNLCGSNGGGCLAGSYKDNDLAESFFARGIANGFMGYSERLFYILRARGGDSALPSVISAPLGMNSNPVMFVDALVLNTNCRGQCAADAETFSRFMSSLRVRNMIAFSQDVSPDTLPRYLLQDLESFYYLSIVRP